MNQESIRWPIGPAVAGFSAGRPLLARENESVFSVEREDESPPKSFAASDSEVAHTEADPEEETDERGPPDRGSDNDIADSEDEDHEVLAPHLVGEQADREHGPNSEAGHSSEHTFALPPSEAVQDEPNLPSPRLGEASSPPQLVNNVGGAYAQTASTGVSVSALQHWPRPTGSNVEVPTIGRPAGADVDIKKSLVVWRSTERMIVFGGHVQLPAEASQAVGKVNLEAALKQASNELSEGEAFTEGSQDAVTLQPSQQSFALPSVKGGGESHSLLARSVSSQVTDAFLRIDGDEIDIALSPEELGSVRFVMSRGESGPSMVVMIERPEVLEALRRNADLLLADLGQSGFEGADLDFREGSNHSQTDDGRSVSEGQIVAIGQGAAKTSQAASSLIDGARLDIRV